LELAFELEDLTEVATFAVLHDQVKFLACLKGIVEIDDEGVLNVREDVAFGLGVLDEIIAYYFVFGLNFHRVVDAT